MSAVLNQLYGVVLRMRYMLPMLAALFALRAFLRHRKGVLCDVKREISLFLLYFTLCALCSQTILSDIGDFSLQNVGINIKTTPFAFVNDIFYYGKSYFLINIVGNIAFFVVIGALYAACCKAPSLLRTCLFGFAVSLFVEAVQLFLPRCTDVDDLLLNTFGALLGYFVFLSVRKVFTRNDKSTKISAK